MSIELEDRGKALEDEYFYKKEKELVAKMKEKMDAEKAAHSQLNCPKCDGKLNEVAYENIQIDVCDKCGGVWLDAGELAQVMHHDEGKSWFSRLLG